jgi:hypothetical protein
MGRSTASKARRAWPLVAAACLSALYLGITIAAGGWEGRPTWDGVLGVVLGLFICSIPVRHFLDLLIYWRIEGARFRSLRALSWWVAANAAVLAAGWLVIVVGTTRFTAS